MTIVLTPINIAFRKNRKWYFFTSSSSLNVFIFPPLINSVVSGVLCFINAPINTIPLKDNKPSIKIATNNSITYLFNSLMVSLAVLFLLKYPIIFDITEDRDLSSISAISFRKSSFSFVVLNDRNDDFFIMKSYNIVWHIMTKLFVWHTLTFYN